MNQDCAGPIQIIQPHVNGLWTKPANHGMPSVKKEIKTLSHDATDIVIETVEDIEILVINDRQISDQDLRDYISSKGIKSVELIDCKFSGDTIAETLVKLINQDIETIVLSGSDILGDHLKYISENMSEDNELRNIDLSHIALDEIGVTAISKIMAKASKLEWMNLHNCELDGNLLKKMLEEDERITNNPKKLTISSNPEIGDCIETIAAIADKFNCEEIDISSNSLDGAHFAMLSTTNAPSKVSTLRVCENPIDEWNHLGELVKKWNIETLDASFCIMYVEDSHEFAEALSPHRLKTLHLHHPDLCKPLEDSLRNELKETADKLTFD